MVGDDSCYCGGGGGGGGQLRLKWWEVCTKPKIETPACGAQSHKQLPHHHQYQNGIFQSTKAAGLK